MMGDPGLFSGLLKIGGKLLRGVPGIGTALTIADLGSMAIKPAAGALSKLKLLKPPTMPGGIVPYDPLFAARQLTSRTKGLGKLGKGLIAGGAVAGAGAGAAALLGGGTARRRYRRMNLCNGKALRRSMRRVEGFAKIAHETISFTKRVKLKKHRKR